MITKMIGTLQASILVGILVVVAVSA